MAYTKVSGWFSKIGKGVKQVELKNFDGSPMLEDVKDKETGVVKQVPVIGNEQYLCEQLAEKNPDGSSSVASDSPANFTKDVLELTDNDLVKASKIFREGWNRITRLETSTDDPFTKAAKDIQKIAESKASTGTPFEKYRGKSIEEISKMLRESNV